MSTAATRRRRRLLIVARCEVIFNLYCAQGRRRADL